MGIALEKFRADMEKLQKGIEFQKLAEEFSSCVATVYPDGYEMQEYEAKAQSLQTFIQSHRQALAYFPPSVFLYTCGRFEYYVRSALEELAADVAIMSGSYRKMPSKMRESIVEFTTEVIKTPRKYGHGDGAAKAFAQSLADNLNLDSHQIHPQCLSITYTNMRPEIIDELFKRLGFKEIWTIVGQQLLCKQRYGTTDPSKVSTDAQEELKAIMDERNKVAHPAAETTLPSVQTVEGAISYFLVIAAAIDVFVETMKVKHQADLNR